MSETKIEQNYDQDKITEQLLQSVSEMYLNPPKGFADKNGHMKINELAAEFSMTWIKIWKLFELEMKKMCNYSEPMSLS